MEVRNNDGTVRYYIDPAWNRTSVLKRWQRNDNQCANHSTTEVVVFWVVTQFCIYSKYHRTKNVPYEKFKEHNTICFKLTVYIFTNVGRNQCRKLVGKCIFLVRKQVCLSCELQRESAEVKLCDKRSGRGYYVNSVA